MKNYIVHIELHPFLFILLLSSQASPGLTTPLPHLYQTLGAPVQLQLVSIYHVELQPFPFEVLPSSQASPVFMTPLLQISEQTLGVALVQE